MWNWLKGIFAAIMGGANKAGQEIGKVAADPTVDAVAMAGLKAAAGAASPQTATAINAVVALAPVVAQLAQQVQATHAAVQAAASAVQAAAPNAQNDAAHAAALASHAMATQALASVTNALLVNATVPAAQAPVAPVAPAKPAGA